VYFLFYGMSESHMDAIETVLERHGLALVTQRAEGGPFLMGIIDADQRRIWETMRDLGSAEPLDVATAAGLTPERVERVLDDLWRRRLVIREDKAYISVANARPFLAKSAAGEPSTQA
jgi:hypothetical protein